MNPVIVLCIVSAIASFYALEVVWTDKKAHFYDKVEKSIYTIVVSVFIVYINELIYRGAFTLG